MTPASSRGARKAIRDAFQALLAVIAGGGTFALLEVIVGSVNPLWGALLTLLFKFLVAYAQNRLEAQGSIPVMLPTPGLVTTAPASQLVGKTVATVDTVLEEGGGVVGDVLNRTGDLVGVLTGGPAK